MFEVCNILRAVCNKASLLQREGAARSDAERERRARGDWEARARGAEQDAAQLAGKLHAAQREIARTIASVNLSSHGYLPRWRRQNGGKNRESDRALLGVQRVHWFLINDTGMDEEFVKKKSSEKRVCDAFKEKEEVDM
ncbi:unnamed protein product [Parnassius apollo]|uniref:(apollo) hypothetical protein n=1 Tax=Parnassius apollo TaxID=110799 RepID=A0A8S3X9T1_PARAO|nr:unnamed protein product [Parnassius apollo]